MKSLAFAHKIVAMSKIGDMDAVADALKAYWTDKRSHPWHLLYKAISKYWKNDRDGDLREALVYIRDAVFGSLDLLSLSLPLDLTTEELLSVLIRGKTWPDGRRRARGHCTQQVDAMIKQGRVEYLIPSALERDGLGFLVPRLRKAKIEVFRKAKPRLRRGRIDLRPLHKSSLGRRFLRQQGISEQYLQPDDPRVENLEEAFEMMLVELELEDSRLELVDLSTEQVTLNGSPVEDVAGDETHKTRDDEEHKGVQAPLTEFIPDGSRPKAKTRQRASKRRRSKRAASKTGGKDK